jgi:hypothetical protein
MTDPAPSPGLCDPTAHSRGGGPVCRPRLPPRTRAESGVWLPPSRRTPPSLPAREAPERPWASPFKAFSSSRQAPLSGALPSWRYHGRSHRGVRLLAADFRASISRRARAGVGLRRTRPSMPSWDSPLQSLLPIRSGMRFDRAAGPPTHLAGRRPGPPGSQGFAKRMDRLVRLRTAGSPGVLYLSTVAALRSPGRGAGSWIHLARDAGCVRHRTLFAPSTPTQPGVRTPDPAPPSIGLRLATSSVRPRVR